MKFGNDNESVVPEQEQWYSNSTSDWCTQAYKAPISHSSQEKGYIPKRNKTAAFLTLPQDTCG